MPFRMERLKVQMMAGLYNKITITHHLLQPTQKIAPQSVSVSVSPRHSRFEQLLTASLLAPAPNLVPISKSVTDHRRCHTLVSLPPASPWQQPPLRHTRSLPLFPTV